MPRHNDYFEVKIEHPLLGLINSCEMICVRDCCGIDAFDFSPVSSVVKCNVPSPYRDIAMVIKPVRERCHEILLSSVSC